MSRTLASLLLPLAILVLPGCASIVTGHNQPVSLQTPDCEGASCTLTNSKGTWYVKTPGTVTVHRAYGDLTIVCSKDGYPSATSTSASATKAMAFGNILFGGLIGVGVDVGTGAAYDYPALMTNPIACKGAANAAAPAPAAAGTATPSAMKEADAK